MGKMSTTKIDLPYTPSLTLEKVSKVLSDHFPQYPQVWPFAMEGIALKKRPYALACVRIVHKERKNRTRIMIYGSMTPISTIYAGFLWYMIAIGDLVDQVEDVIRQELPNMLNS